MKKEYKRPLAESVQLETAPVMSTSSTELGGANVGDKPVGSDTPDYSAGRRNVWGKLW